METLIFWGVIVLFLLAGLQSGVVASFSLMISSMTSLYLAFWLYDFFLPLSILVPPEYTEYFKPSALLILFLVFYLFLQSVFKVLCKKYKQNCTDYEVTVFSKPVQFAAASVFNFLTGISFMTLLFLTVAVIPMTADFEQVSIPALQRNAANGLHIVNSVVDIASFQPNQKAKKEAHLKAFLSYDALEEQRIIENELP